jgi:hypothetical protein
MLRPPIKSLQIRQRRKRWTSSDEISKDFTQKCLEEGKRMKFIDDEYAIICGKEDIGYFLTYVVETVYDKEKKETFRAIEEADYNRYLVDSETGTKLPILLPWSTWKMLKKRFEVD